MDRFSDIQIFQTATNYTGVFQFKYKKKDIYDFHYHQYKNENINKINELFENSLRNASSEKFKEYVLLNSSDLNNDVWNFQTHEVKKTLEIINKKNPTLNNFCESIFQGISSGKDEVFYINEDIIRKYKIEKKILKKILKGKDIKSYTINWSGNYVIYPYDLNSNVKSESILKEEFPNTYKYFLDNKFNLSGRKYFDNSKKLWFELWNQRNPQKFNKMRIVVPDISSKCNFALTDEFYGNTTTYHLIPKFDSLKKIKILLALLNTDVIDYYFKKITTPQRGGFFRYKTKFLEKIPINENFFNHSEIVDMVDKLLINYSSNLTNSNNKEIIKILNNINNYASKLYNIKINN